MTQQQERDLARIAELRKLARAAQGRPEGPAAEPAAPIAKWTSGAGEIQRVAVGPGQQVITIDAAARRLGMTVDELRSTAKILEVGSWGMLVVELVEVERLEIGQRIP